MTSKRGKNKEVQGVYAMTHSQVPWLTFFPHFDVLCAL